VNVFFGDSGLHWPRVENQEFQPGFLSIVLVGGLAALVSWGATKAIKRLPSSAQMSKQSASQPAILPTLFSLDSVERSGSRAKWKRMCSKRLRRSRLRSRRTRMPPSPLRQELQIKRSQRLCKCEHR
jgi:hypothetical protein